MNTASLFARRLVLTAALLPFTSACLTDDDAPAAPVLDEVRARTSLAKLHLTGSAEYNAKVVAKGPGGKVDAVADGRTGAFALDLPLDVGENAITVVATDIGGNSSKAAKVTVTQEPARAEVVRVSLPRTVISADDAALEVIIDIANDEPEIPLEDLGVTLTIPEDPPFDAQAITVNDTGHAVLLLADLHISGTFTVRVEADVVGLDGNAAFDQAGFTVTPGRPAVVDVALSATVDGSGVGPGNAISVPADTAVDVGVTVKDAYDNLVEGAPIRIDAPGSGATVLGDVLVGLTRAGSYEVVADTGSGLVAGTADLTITAAAADHLELSVDAALVEAGTLVTAVAFAVDAFGNTVTDALPELDIDAPQPFGAPLTGGGVATATVTVTTAGAYTITASDPASAATAASAGLQVVAAAPVNGNFIEIDAAGLPYQAGEPVTVDYQLLDAFGNVNSSVPVLVTVNAPNVSVTDSGAGIIEINGIVRSGSYLVRGRAVGTGLPDDVETLVVDPNPELAGFNLLLSSALIAEFGTLVFNGTDGFGNLIDEGDITTTFSDDTAITRNGAQLTFNRPGSYSVTACITGTTLCDTEFISVQGLLDTVPPVATITIESPISGSTVVRGQRVVFSVDVTDDRALSSLSFVASFGSNGTCRTTGGPVLFPGTLSESVTFSFGVPNCAIPLDVVSIVAQASDQAGNTRNTADETLTLTDPFQLTFPGDPANGTFLTTVVAFQDRIDGPTGLDVDPISGTIYVANGSQGNRTNRSVGITLDRVQFDLTDQNGNRVDLRDVRSVAASSAGNLFFGVAETQNGGGGSSGIIRVTRDLTRQTFVSSTTPGGQAEAITAAQFQVPQLALDDASTATPALCMVIRDQDHIWCYGNLDADPQAAQRLAEVEINGLRPRSIAFDAPDDAGDSDVLWVALDGGTHVLRPFTFNAGRTTLTAVPGGDIDISAEVNGAAELGDLAVGPQPAENLYLVDRNGGRVLKVDRTGAQPVISVLVDNLSSPSGLVFDGDSLLITDDNDRVVFRLVPDPLNPGAF